MALTGLIIGAVVLFSPIQPQTHTFSWGKQAFPYSKLMECPKQCQKKGFAKPPLVIVSLDGFARQYFDRFVVEALRYMAKCGSTVERVYPPFPSKTFPSHYTMVTGLYPESHGIVDNYAFDPKISSKMENMKRKEASAFFKGDPIWNVYKRNGGRSACLYWAGCAVKISGLRPDIAPPYSDNLTFRKRFDMVVEWLLLPEWKRPGLILVYLDQPDGVGHHQVGDKDIEVELAKLDKDLQYFFNYLKKKDLLSCINLAIVSDHGMQRLKNTVYFSQMIKAPGIMVPPSGVVGRIYKYQSAASTDELMKPFKCDRGNRWKVYRRSSMATRKHYQKTSRVGDVIVEGELGTIFSRDPKHDWHLRGDHGYDYIRSPMQTVFFAMGPSIRRGVVLPPLQNIEYMNLWIDLLSLPHNVANNGTLGLMDDILVQPPFRSPTFRPPLSECFVTGPPGAISCHSCSAENLNWIRAKLSCVNPPSLPVQISSTTSRCFQNYCEKIVIVGGGKDSSVAVVEQLRRRSAKPQNSCKFVNSKYQTTCPYRAYSSEFVTKTLSADTQSEFANIWTIEVNWRSGFVFDVINPLNELTQSIADRLGRLVVITGTAFDYNYDGIADGKTSSLPSHLYRVLIACSGAWSADGLSCQNPANTMVLPFIFPHIEKDVNCLKKEDLMLEYTARLRDVELISGLRFHFPSLSRIQRLRLKTHINTKLW